MAEPVAESPFVPVSRFCRDMNALLALILAAPSSAERHRLEDKMATYLRAHRAGEPLPDIEDETA